MNDLNVAGNSPPNPLAEVKQPEHCREAESIALTMCEKYEPDQLNEVIIVFLQTCRSYRAKQVEAAKIKYEHLSNSFDNLNKIT